MPPFSQAFHIIILGFLGPHGGGGSPRRVLEDMSEADPESHTELEMSDA